MSEPEPRHRVDRDDDEDDVGAEESPSPVFPYNWVPWGGGGGAAFAPADGTVDATDDDLETASGDDHRWLDEGIFTAIILVGAALFVFPEPATSMIGVGLMLFGITGWLVDGLLGGF